MFKRFISNAAILITAVLLSFSFISCGSKLDTGEVVFNFSSVFAQNSARNASEDQKADADDVYSAKVILYVDEIPQEQSLEWTKDSHQDTMSFTNIPVGSIVYAKAWVYKNSDLQYSGQTNTIVMKAGKNTLVLELKKGDGSEGGEVPFVISGPVILWNNKSYEKSIKINEFGNPTAFQLDELYTVGCQIFSEIKSGTKITETTFNSPIYCFGNNCIYVVGYSEGFVIEKYIPSGSDYVKDEAFNVNINQLALESDDLQYEIQSITAITCTDDYLYLGLFLQSSKNPMSVPVAIPLSNPDKIMVYYNGGFSPNDRITAMAAGKIDGTPVLCYVRDSTLYKGTPVIVPAEETTPDRLNLSDTGWYEMYTDFGEPYWYPEVGDIQINGNYVYVAYYAYSDTMNTDDDMYSEENGTTFKTRLVSNGGIAKLSLISNDFEPEAWKNGEMLFGWYRADFWKKDYDENWTEHKNQTMAPPEELSDKYFYGLRKFIAKKPDELVIADDGAYLDLVDDEKLNKVGNINRVVSINLKDESISTVDVDVSFNVSINKVTGFGLE